MYPAVTKSGATRPQAIPVCSPGPCGAQCGGEGKSVMAKAWRDGEVAKAMMFTDERDGEIVTKEIRGSVELVLWLQGFFIPYLK